MAMRAQFLRRAACQYVAMVVDGTKVTGVRFWTVDASPPRRTRQRCKTKGPRPDGDRWWSRWRARVGAVRR